MITATLSCVICQQYASQSWGDGFIDQRVTEEYCKKHQWEFEEPIPSPVTTCNLFDFALPEYKEEEVINLDDYLLEEF